ncbi:hypothetical protein [Pelagibius sp. 7325]|uniref:hypothetical protein n=1 Tax=Pelagibius sp. 7325 TaxID=3131994 RepID=UPI0030EC4B96
MTHRTLLAAGTAIALLGGPMLSSGAWAACADETQALNQQIVAAETGATMQGDMPATEHQQEVMSGSGQTGDMPAGEAPPMETAAGATGTGGTGDVEATSPHQRQVVRSIDEDARTEAAQLLAEAEDLAAAGDEAACMTKLEEVRALLPAE